MAVTSRAINLHMVFIQLPEHTQHIHLHMKQIVRILKNNLQFKSMYRQLSHEYAVGKKISSLSQ